MSLGAAINALAGLLWGPPTVALLLGIGVYLTIRLRFVQVVRLPLSVRLLLASDQFGESSKQARGDVSPRGALSVSLATVIGNGNIAGVCTAIELGGPGAVFWMWISAFFGMATKLVEATLGQRFKVASADGAVAGGPMYYITSGLGWPWLGALFAVCMGCKALFSTSIVQSNSIAVALHSQMGGPSWVFGLVLAGCTWLAIIGGLQSIVRVTMLLTPLMVALFFGGAATALIRFGDRVPDALRLIVVGAFEPQAVGGGVAGATLATAMRFGLARGAYSNEAGTGTAGVFHASAKTSEPTRQGLLASLDVFLDTFVVCTLTAMVVIVTGAWKGGATSTAMAADAFSQAAPLVGGWIVALSSLLFGLSSLIGTPYYGETAFGYLLGVRIKIPFRWVYCGMVFVGPLLTARLAWSLGDILNGCMTITNVVGLIGLAGLASKLVGDFTYRSDISPQDEQ